MRASFAWLFLVKLALVLPGMVVLAGCATGRVTAATPPPRVAKPPRPTPPRPPAPRPGDGELTGQASWYGRQHHGKKTASGETYDMHKLTAAHRSLPMGTRVLVTNVENGRTVEVRINDRGPYVRERMLDLSYAAARRLGAVGDGVIPVSVKVLDDAAAADEPTERPPPKP